MERQLRRPACSAYAAFAVHDNPGKLDVPPGEERRQPENRGLGIAARIGDEPGLGDLIGIKLGQSINRLGEMCQILVAFTVPLSVGIGSRRR